MSLISLRDLSRDYRYKVPPFYLKRDIFGPEYVNSRSSCSIREWLEFDWVRYKLNKRMMEDLRTWARNDNLSEDSIQNIQISLEKNIEIFESRIRSMTEIEKQDIKGNFISPSSLGISSISASSESVGTEPLVSGLIPGLPVPWIPNPGVSFPGIPVPGFFPLPIPGIDPDDLFQAISGSTLVEFVGTKLTGLVGGALETVKQVILGLSEEINYSNRSDYSVRGYLRQRLGPTRPLASQAIRMEQAHRTRSPDMLP